MFKCWHHDQNRRQFSPRYYARGHEGIRFLRGMEWRKRDSVHFHVLMIECDRLSIETTIYEWRKLAGDAKIEPYDPRKDATFHMSKVYGPWRGGALDFGGEWDKVEPALPRGGIRA